MLEDVHQRSQFARKPAGIVNPKAVDLTTFVASTVSVAMSAATLLAMIWNRIDPLLGLKIMVSVWALMLALLAFRAINRSFAEYRAERASMAVQDSPLLMIAERPATLPDPRGL